MNKLTKKRNRMTEHQIWHAVHNPTPERLEALARELLAARRRLWQVMGNVHYLHDDIVAKGGELGAERGCVCRLCSTWRKRMVRRAY